MTFDAKGRLWVTTMPSYPMYLPGQKPNDKVLIFEDTNDDGKADTLHGVRRRTARAHRHRAGRRRRVRLPAAQPDVPEGHRRRRPADTRELIMHGFDTADCHHAMHAFTWDPGGALYWQEGTFHHTQVETPYGPRRVQGGGHLPLGAADAEVRHLRLVRLRQPVGPLLRPLGPELRRRRLRRAPIITAPPSPARSSIPQKHGGMKQFFPMQWRPTCGCELVYQPPLPRRHPGRLPARTTTSASRASSAIA